MSIRYKVYGNNNVRYVENKEMGDANISKKCT